MSAPDDNIFEDFGTWIVVLVIVFILVYTGLNAIVVLRLGGLLGLERSILYSWIAIISLSLPVAMFAERIYPNIVSRILYTVATLWMGVLLFLVCSLLIYEVVRFFFPITYAGIMILVVVSLLSIVSVINAIGIAVKEVEIPVEGLDEDVSIVQISDPHIGTIRNSAFLTRVIEKASRLDPDVVMITGDLIDASARVHGGMFEEFDRFGAPVYFVTGNHEVYEGVNDVYSTLEDTGIRVLRNEIVESDDIQIVGVEYSENDEHLGKELEKLKIDKTRPAVLMYHSPEGIDDARQAGIDLQLAGHTHAGQIFPFNFLVRVMFPHITGLYELGGMFLYVSPGTGTWGPYMRLGSRNEISVIELKAK